MIGGEVINSGGYGCIFDPQLSCSGEKEQTNVYNDNSNDKKISKLMTKRNANAEFKLIKQFDDILSNIPNYKMYFRTYNIEKCVPEKLSKKDLVGFTKKCRALQKRGFTRKNINRKIKKLSVISMPDAGVTLSQYLKPPLHIYPNENIKLLVISMNNLLVNGIIPMNNLNVYHGDIKSENVMIKNNTPRLIDWGSAFIQKNDAIQENAASRPLQFNIPYSCILLNFRFLEAYTDFLEISYDDTLGIAEKEMQIFTFIEEFLQEFIKEFPGHIKTIKYICSSIYNDNKEIPSIVTTYLTNIVYEYTESKTFNVQKYYNNVYLKNIDIWGFVFSFGNMIELLNINKKTLMETDKVIYKIFIEIISTVIEKDTEPIDHIYISNLLKMVVDLYPRDVQEKLSDILII